MNEKTTFFRKVIISIKDFDKYVDFAASSFKQAVSYILKLVAVFTIFLSLIAIYNVSKQINNAKKYIEEQIDVISYEDEKLKVENKELKPIIIENEILNKIIIDTTEDKQKQDEYIEEIKKFSSGIVLLRDKMILKPETSNSMVITYSYSEILNSYNINKFDKQDILNGISGSNLIKVYLIIFALTFIYQYIVCIINILIFVVLIGILGYFTAIILRMKLRYIAICKMVAHSLTLPILLNILYIVINTFTGFEIEYFDIIYIAISYIYVITAILLIKADLIKRGQELQELIKEQERIKQEMEQKKLEEERKKEEEKKKKREDEKKKKQAEKEKEGKEPQGDNA